MKIKFLIEVKVFKKLGWPGVTKLYSCNTFLVSKILFEGFEWSAYSRDLHSCHARKGHASPDRATIGAQNCIPILSAYTNFEAVAKVGRRHHSFLPIHEDHQQQRESTFSGKFEVYMCIGTATSKEWELHIFAAAGKTQQRGMQSRSEKNTTRTQQDIPHWQGGRKFIFLITGNARSKVSSRHALYEAAHVRGARPAGSTRFDRSFIA